MLIRSVTTLLQCVSEVLYKNVYKLTNEESFWVLLSGQ